MDTKKYQDAAILIMKDEAKEIGKKLILEVLLPLAKEAALSSPSKWDDMALLAVEDSVNKFIAGL